MMRSCYASREECKAANDNNGRSRNVCGGNTVLSGALSSAFIAALDALPIYYTASGHESDALIQRHILDAHVSQVVFDTEAHPTFSKGKCNPVALVQLHTGTVCLLLHIIHFTEDSPLLCKVLKSKSIVKVGYAIRNDVRAMGSPPHNTISPIF